MELYDEFFDQHFTAWTNSTRMGGLKLFIDFYSTFFQPVFVFNWLHVCVTVVPIVLFGYAVFLSITTAFTFYRISTRILVLKQRQLSPEKFNRIKHKISYAVTISNTESCIGLLGTLLFLEVVNIVNWKHTMPLFGGFFISSPAISFLVCLVLILALLGFYLVQDLVIRFKLIVNDLLCILLFLVFFLLLILYSHNLLALFIGVEGTAICTVVGLALFQAGEVSVTQFISPLTQVVPVKSKYIQLLAYWKLKNKINQEAVASSMVYFLLNLFITICLGYLFFFSIFFFNTLSFFSLNTLFSLIALETYYFEVGLIIVFFIVIFSFKLGIPPFHFWLPAVFSGSNYVMLFFLAVPIKFVFSLLLFKIYNILLINFFVIWAPLFTVLGLVAIFVGSVGLFYETNLKRFLAYSTINHFGNMFLAFGVGNFMGQNAFLIYLFTYLITNIAFLYFVSTLVNPTTGKLIYSLSELSHVQFTSFTSQIVFAATLLSLIGVPPFLGFWGKLVLFQALLTQSPSGYFLCFFLICTTVIAASSYLNVFKVLFIASYKNHQLVSQTSPVSIMHIRILLYLTGLITSGFLYQYVDPIPELFNDFIFLLLISV